MEDKLLQVHADIRPVISDFAAEMNALFGADLVSVILYGSGAGNNFIPKKSNINFLVILESLHLAHLQKYKKRAAFWKKKQIVPPLFCARGFLSDSKDVFPMEWLEMIAHHILIHGENQFDFTVENRDLRRQCEKEIREGQIRLRQAFLETGDGIRDIENLATASLNSILPVLRSLLTLQKEPSPPVERENLIRRFCEKNGIDPQNLLKVWGLKKGEPVHKDDLMKRFEGYMNDLNRIADLIHQLEIR